MTQPAGNASHRKLPGRTSHQSVGPQCEASGSSRATDGGRIEVLVNSYGLDRPLISQGQLLFTVVEVAKILSLSRTKVYELLYAGELPSVKIGASRRVRRADLEKFVSDLELAD